ncbi:hypothetical protein HaLaN_19732 [Haematococcus lacustris]|uniref:Uncharacterized protein n=1 Tax=Haematococcus lacustris TaxID=44745 RepID=A0A699ZUA6_HAELA|nr:hypothetical protein HaLaN_19732 [Haematococcus lacustris]
MDDIVVARMASQLLLDAGHPAFTSFAKIKSEIPEDMCEMNLVDRYRQVGRGLQ